MKQPLDRLRSRKKPVSKRVSLSLDSDIADEYLAARDQADKARERAERFPQDRDLADIADEAEAEAAVALGRAQDTSAWFVCRSLSPRAWDDLVDAHLPTEDQRRKARKDGIGQLGWNPDTFPPAALVACVSYVAGVEEDGTETLEPLDEGFVKDLYESGEWNGAEVMGLFSAVIEVNTSRRVVDLGNGSRRTARS